MVSIPNLYFEGAGFESPLTDGFRGYLYYLRTEQKSLYHALNILDVEREKRPEPVTAIP
jgi:hypothetical protein